MTELADLTGVPGRDEFPAAHKIVYCFEVLFDTQIEPETWADWLASCYVTHVEFHSYMPAHELVDTGGASWNSHAGDPRLWTSRAALQAKIDALHRRGIHAILYASAYAASPAFFARYPDWAAYWPDGRPVFFPDILPPYLVIQAMNRSAHRPYTIAGRSYDNYRAYIMAEVSRAVAEYGFDGVRMDFYAMPDTYKSPSFAGLSNMSDDLVDFIAELRPMLKAIRPDTLISVIELPNVDGDRIRRGVARDGSVDIHWLELWPQDDQTGPRYADLIREIRLTRALAPESGIVAAYYPQNPPYEGYPLLPDGWPAANMHYNYATAFAAGSSWGGQSVGGHGSFTQVLPFKFAYMDLPRLTLSRDWSRFMAEYGPYYAWDNPIFRFEPLDDPVIAPGVRALLYARRDRRNDQQDALVLQLINYGPNSDWAQIAGAPEPLENLSLRLPHDGATARRVFALDPGGNPIDLSFEQHGALTIVLPQLDYYKLIVVELTANSTLPSALTAAPALDDRAPEPFDIGGNTIWGHAARISLLNNDEPFAISTFSMVGGELVAGDYSLSDEDAYSGSASCCVTAGRVKFSATKTEAIRFNLNNFPLVSFAWKAAGARQMLVAFEIVNMDTGAVGEVVYNAGVAQIGQILIGTLPGEWQQVRRDLLADLHSTAWGVDWHNAAVIALSLGAEGKAFFDAIAAERTPDWAPLHIKRVLAPAAVDLGSSQLVGRVDFAAVGAYEIQASNDPDFRVYTSAVIAATDAAGAHVFAEPINARYVRVKLADGGDIAGLEMRVFTR